MTCGQSKRRRRRGCDPPKHGGKECPSDRKQYEEWSECGGNSCPDPQWTKWSPWGKCSMTCGLGKKRKTRTCEDAVTKQPLIPNLDCIGGGVELSEDCKEKDCGSKYIYAFRNARTLLHSPRTRLFNCALHTVDGKWTEWLNWGSCSVLCGKQGHRNRKRYCANPLPQFGGKKCPGTGTERGDCKQLKPCPGNNT